MIASLLVTFLVIFALVAVSISVGQRYLETQKTKKVTELLKTAVSEQAKFETSVLIDRVGGATPALLAFLDKLNLVKKLDERIKQSGMNLNPVTLLLLMAGLTIPGALLGLRLNILMYPTLSAAAFGLIFGVAPYLVVGRARTKRMNQFEEQFPEALDFLARAMRAGHAFSISLEMLSDESPQPLGIEFKKVFNECNLGLPVETALTNLTERMPLIDVRFFVSAVLLQRETGGNLAEILTKLAFVIRERFKLRGQVKAASAHGRITGTILTLMPVALMFGLLLVAPGYLQGMANNATGKWMIATVIIFLFIGHLVIKKIVKIKV